MVAFPCNLGAVEMETGMLGTRRLWRLRSLGTGLLTAEFGLQDVRWMEGGWKDQDGLLDFSEDLSYWTMVNPFLVPTATCQEGWG